MSAPLTATGAANALAALLQGYRPRAGHYDEMLAADGSIRPHWQGPLAFLAGLGEADRQQALDTAQRQLQENGLAYITGGDEEGQSRPWQLDLLPVLFEASEWQRLEAALVQRARLLNAITADLYGPQRLIAEGHLPAAAVYASPHFVRPCAGVEVPADTWLHLLAFDLVRAPDGRWLVVSDRTEAPSGSGFALENRIVVSRSLPELFRASNVERLATFFRAFSEHFLALSRHDPPLVTVLSPSEQRDSYFEHVYLAQYLGYNIVQGADLTVRGDRLFLKTVEGLKPVDLMVRQAGSLDMDPLELPGAGGGIAGLMRAVRGGRVAIANAIGSGLTQSDVLLGYLPKLCRLMLGEDLALDSVATWWCGEEAGRRHVLANLERLAVHDVTKSKALLRGDRESYLLTKGDEKARRRLETEIALRGQDFVGREVPNASTTPLWRPDGSLEPAAMTVRIYLAATAEGYRAMPGGLVRVTHEGPGSLPVPQGEEISKDAWVVSAKPVEPVTLLPTARQVVALRRTGRELTSRSADNLYWFGRYLERLESAVRLLRSFVVRVAGAQRAGSDQITPGRVVGLLEALQHISPEGAKRFAEEGPSAFLLQPKTFFGDDSCPDNLADLLGAVHRLADTLRERLSRDTWDILQQLLSTPLAQTVLPGYGQAWAARLLDGLIDHLSALNGLVMENMTRDLGWHFLDMGRRLERGWHTTRAIRAITLNDEAEREGGLELMLELADSLMTYSWRYKAEPQLAPILDLLLLEDSNPRSVLFQVEAIERHLATLPPRPEMHARLPETGRLLIGLSSSLKLADIHRLTEARDGPLDSLLEETIAAFERVSDAVTEHYFSHALETRVAGAGVGMPH